MKNALALAALMALAASPATAACYGGPAAQSCNDLHGNPSTGATTMRGYNTQPGGQWNDTVARSGKMTDNKVMANGQRSTQPNRTESRRQSLFYTCTPYRGCR